MLPCFALNLINRTADYLHRNIVEPMRPEKHGIWGKRPTLAAPTGKPFIINMQKHETAIVGRSSKRVARRARAGAYFTTMGATRFGGGGAAVSNVTTPP